MPTRGSWRPVGPRSRMRPAPAVRNAGNPGRNAGGSGITPVRWWCQIIIGADAHSSKSGPSDGPGRLYSSAARAVAHTAGGQQERIESAGERNPGDGIPPPAATDEALWQRCGLNDALSGTGRSVAQDRLPAGRSQSSWPLPSPPNLPPNHVGPGRMQLPSA